ncbi:MAG: nucleoside hydrolase [Actinomycetes bacterium]
MGRAILIDTDPGIDDAVAIALALAVPDVEVIGIATVGGNSGLQNTTRNALRLLEFFGRADIPVASGYDEPYARPKMETGYEPVHGQDGLAGVDLPEPTTKVVSTDAPAFLAEKIRNSPDPVTLVAIGPLTNIAHLVDQHPDVIAMIDRFVIMGGAARTGNVTPVAEFNIWHDPEAAKRVFASGLKPVMVGLDVTHSVKTYENLWEWLSGAGRFGEVFGHILGSYTDFYSSFYGERMTHQHDALAMAEAIWPGIMTLEDAFIDVECQGELTLGMTVTDTRLRHGVVNGQVAWTIDGDVFHERLMSALSNLAATIN